MSNSPQTDVFFRNEKQPKMYRAQSSKTRESSSHDGDVGTIAPDLSGRITIVTHSQNILSGLHIRHLHHVKHRWPLTQTRIVARRGEHEAAKADVRRRVSAAWAVWAWCFWARQACPGRAISWRCASVGLFADFAAAIEVTRVVVVVLGVEQAWWKVR